MSDTARALATAFRTLTAAGNNVGITIDVAEKAIREYGMSDGKGEVARVDFIEKAADFRLKGVIDGADLGKQALHAWTIYNEGKRDAAMKAAKERAFKDGTTVPATPVVAVKASRQSELKQIFKATEIRPDLVTVTREVIAELAARNTDEETVFTGATYQAICDVAREQIRRQAESGNASVKVPMSRTDIEEFLTSSKGTKKKDEAAKLADMIKALNKMQEEFPHNADIYKATIDGLSTALSMVKARASK
jgi:hypothetical protein